RARLAADRQRAVVAVARDRAQRAGRDVLGPQLARERAEVDLEARAGLLADGGEQLLDGRELDAGAARAVRERARRQEAHVAALAAAAQRAHVLAHAGHAAVAEARLERERGLAERAGPDAAARQLDRVPMPVARVERRRGVERLR